MIVAMAESAPQVLCAQAEGGKVARQVNGCVGKGGCGICACEVGVDIVTQCIDHSVFFFIFLWPSFLTFYMPSFVVGYTTWPSRRTTVVNSG